jgi:hypothetical protein
MVARVLLPLGEGGPKGRMRAGRMRAGRMRATLSQFRTLTRRFAGPATVFPSVVAKR